MTDDQIRITIAEACGWKRHEKFKRWRFGGEGDLVCWASLPDYLNDFHAIQTDVKYHTTLSRALFLRFLYFEAMEDPKNPDNSIAFTTARQWCRAFLRAIGRWKYPKQES